MKKKMDNRSTTDIDLNIGAKLRIRRMLLGLSQQELAKKVGITFQQIQKYERGTNRTSAARLAQLAEILDVPISYFYSDAKSYDPIEHSHGGFAETERAGYEVDPLSNKENLELLSAFQRITDIQARRKILDLVKVLAFPLPSNTSEKQSS